MRVHHPDSPSGRDLSPAIRRSRFQAITAAYDSLRGKRSGSGSHGPTDIYRQELERRRRARAAYEASRNGGGFAYERHPDQTWTASADDRWKDRIILFVGIMVRLRVSLSTCVVSSDGSYVQALGAGIGPMLVWPSYTASYQAHLSASRNLATARQEAREYGEERRREISKRVKEFKEKEKLAQERRSEDSSTPSPSLPP